VAEELLLCRSWFNTDIRNHYSENQSAAYEGRQQDGEKLLALARQLPTDFLDIQAHMFGTICTFMGDGVWLTRKSLC
jgi:hypothetical protein